MGMLPISGGIKAKVISLKCSHFSQSLKWPLTNLELGRSVHSGLRG